MSYVPLNPNGTAAAASSSPVVLPELHIPSAAQTNPAVNYEFLTNTSNGWFDALGYSWLSFQLIVSGTITAGKVIVEGTNSTSGASSGVTLTIDNTSNAPSRTQLITLSSPSSQMYQTPVSARYIRVRVQTAVTGGGTVAVAATLKQMAPPASTQIITPVDFQSTAAIGNLGIGAGSNAVGTAWIGNPSPVTDVASTTFTSSSTQGVTNISEQPPSASFVITVTAVSGASPTLDVTIQESHDGSTYVDMYQFERITATGMYFTPPLRIFGAYLRYAVVIGGSLAPSFTCSIIRLPKSTPGLLLRNFYNRTISIGTVSSTTPAYFVQGTYTSCITVVTSGSGTAGQLQLQGSVDGSSWVSVGTVVPDSTNSIARTVVDGVIYKWVRGATSTSSALTLSYVNITSYGP